MDLDALLRHFFGTADLDTLDAAALAGGAERVRLAFATEADDGRRFALWTVLHALDEAPPPHEAFEDARIARLADDYARAAARLT